MERKQRDLDYGRLLSMLNSCISSLKNNEDGSFRKSIKNIFNFIRTIDEKLRLYIHEVINQAQIKKGCKLCEHGISIARASEVLGISQWELMHYIGKTTLIDQFSEPVNVSYRLKIARSLFS
jgi:alpha-glucuronidase